MSATALRFAITFLCSVLLCHAAEQRWAPTTVSASTAQTGNPASHAIDGRLDTRWSAEGIGQWLQLDLGQTRSVSSVRMVFPLGDQRRAMFNIQTSTNGSTWSAVWTSNRSSSGTSTGWQTFTFPSPQSVRYVRLVGAGNDSTNVYSRPWNSLFEFEAWGAPTTTGNRSPVVAASIPNRTATVNTAFSYTIPAGTFSDPDGNPLTWSVSNLPTGLSFNASTRVISGTATATGAKTVTVTVKDPGNLSANTTFSITVEAAGVTLTRQAPTAVSASTAQTGNPASHAIDGRLDTRWSAEGIGQWLQLDLGQTRSVSSVRMVFPLGDQRRAMFNIQTSTNGSTWSAVWSSNRSSSGTSTGWQTFTFPSPQSVRYVRFVGAGNDSTNVYSRPWNSLFEFEAWGTPTTTGNRAPAVAATIPNRTATVNTAFSYTLPAGTFSDPDGNPLTWSVSNLPTGLSFNASTRVISGTPTATGAKTVTVTVKDPGNLSTSTTFSITVNPASISNRAPVVATTIPNQTATVNVAFSYTISVGTFSDPDGNALTWSVSNLPTGLSFNASTRVISGTPTATGVKTVTVTAKDPGTLSASTTFDITVEAAGVTLIRLAPTAVSASTAQTGNPASHAIDGRLDTRWSAEGIGQWLQIDLGQTRSVSSVRMVFPLGDQRRAMFNIQTSTNGSTWSAVWTSNRSSSGTSTGWQTFTFPSPHFARYVRFVGAGNDSTNVLSRPWNSLFEMDIMGPESSASWPKLAQGPWTPDAATTGLPAFTTPGGMVVRLGNRYVFAGATSDWKALNSTDETRLSSDAAQTVEQVPWQATPVIDPRQPSRLHIATPDGLPIPGATVSANGQTVTTDGHGDVVILADPTKSTSATVTLPNDMTFIGGNVFTIPVVANTSPRLVTSPTVQVEPGLDIGPNTGPQRTYGYWDTTDVPADANGHTFRNRPWYKWSLYDSWYSWDNWPPHFNRSDMRVAVNGSMITIRFRKDCISKGTWNDGAARVWEGDTYTHKRAKFLMKYSYFDGQRGSPPGGRVRYALAHPEVLLTFASDGWSQPININMSGIYKRQILGSYTGSMTYLSTLQILGYGDNNKLVTTGTLVPTVGASQNVPETRPDGSPLYRIWENSRFALLDGTRTSRVSLADLEIIEGTSARIALVNPPTQRAISSLMGETGDLSLARLDADHGAHDAIDRLVNRVRFEPLTADDGPGNLHMAMVVSLQQVISAAVTPSEVVYLYRLKDQYGTVVESDAGQWKGSWSQLMALGSKPANERAVVLKTGSLTHGRYTVEFFSSIRMPGVDKSQLTLPPGATWSGEWIDNGWRHGCQLLVMPSRRITFSVTLSKAPGFKAIPAAIDKAVKPLGAKFEVKDKGSVNGYIEWKPRDNSGFLQVTVGLNGALETEAKLRGPIDLTYFGLPTVVRLPPGAGATGFLGPYVEGKLGPFVTFSNFKIDYFKPTPPDWSDPLSWIGGTITGGLKGALEIGLGLFVESTDLAAVGSVEVKGGGSVNASGLAGLDWTRSGVEKGILFWRSQLGQLNLVGEIKAKFTHPRIPGGGVEVKFAVNQQVWSGIKIPQDKDNEWIDIYSSMKQVGNSATGGPTAGASAPLNYRLSP